MEIAILVLDLLLMLPIISVNNQIVSFYPTFFIYLSSMLMQASA